MRSTLLGAVFLLLAAVVPADAQLRNTNWNRGVYTPPALATREAVQLSVDGRSVLSPRLRAYLTRGALVGGAVGLASGIAVRVLCGSTCDHAELATISLYTAAGAVGGAAAGGLVYLATRGDRDAERVSAR